MAQVSLRERLRRLASAVPSGGRSLTTTNQHRWRPNLETLEGRCLPSTVTNLNDAGPGSLRQAIIDTPAGGTVNFQPSLSGTIPLTTGELMIAKDLTIAGPGVGMITISGNHVSRVISIAAASAVDISGLIIADGKANPSGGGIYNAGTLTISHVVIRGNSVSFPGLGGPGLGGGIYNTGSLTISYSTLLDNSAAGGFADNGNPGEGGGLYNSGSATVTYSTLTNNSASGGSGGSGYNRGLGGAIANASMLTLAESTLTGNSTHGLDMAVGAGIENTGTLTVTNTTISGNAARGTGGRGQGGIDNASRFNLWNTIVAGNMARSGPDMYGQVTSLGHNLIGDGSDVTGLTETDLVGTAENPIDPLLGPLLNNGGPTQTMALLPGSPAIDAGDNTDAPMWDQRGPGFPRIIHGTIDIGAFEYRAPRQLDPNPVPISEPGLGPEVMQPGLACSRPRLEIDLEALATALPVQPQMSVSAMPLPWRAFVHDRVPETAGDLLVDDLAS
jgi:hypothetical protein